MTARKSIRRSSRFSIQSQMSGVLNPDSYVDGDEEDNPLWFRDFENNSVAIRPSARFSSAQNDTPVLNPDSEPDSTPLQKSWWKNLDNTTEARGSVPDVSQERSSISEKTLDTSEIALLNEGVAKPRVEKRRIKRKSSQRNVFSDILASTSRASSTHENSKTSGNQDKDESSVSYTDSSVERIRQPPLKKKKKFKKIRDLLNSESDDNEPDIFEDALDAPDSGNDTRPETTTHNHPGTSYENREPSYPSSSRLDGSKSGKGGVPSDISEDTIVGADSDLDGRKSPLISLPKKRLAFTKTGTRKSANFDDLLMNVQSEDEPSLRAEPEVNRSKSRIESGDQPTPELAPGSDISFEEDDSELEESIKKQRVKFARKKRGNQHDRIFARFEDSPNTSIRSEPVIGHNKTPEFVRPRDIPMSDVERRSSEQRNSRSHMSGSLNLEAGEQRAARTPVRQSSGANKSAQRSVNEKNNRTTISSSRDVDENNEARRTSIRQFPQANVSDSDERSISERDEGVEPSSPSDLEMEENQQAKKLHRSSGANKSDKERRSKNKASDREKSSDSPNIDVEENRSVRIAVRRSGSANISRRLSVDTENDHSRTSESPNVDDEENEAARKSRGADEFDAEEQTMLEDADCPESSSPLDVDEVGENQPARKSRSRSSGINEFGKGGRSGNETNDYEKSHGSPNAENDISSTPRILTPRSGSANKSRDSVQNKSLLNQSRTSGKRWNIEDKTPPRVNEKSMSQELPVSSGEEQDKEEEIPGIVEESRNVSGLITRSQIDRADSTESVRPEHREAGSPRNEETAISSTSTSANKTGDKRKSATKTPRRSILTSKPKKTIKAVEKTNTDMGKENSEIGQSMLTSVQNTRTQAVGHFSFADSIGRGPVQQPSTFSQGFDEETLAQMKIKLAQVKKQELANLKHINDMKNTKIDDYFKSTSTTKSTAAGKGAKKSPTKPKPVNKAYILDGQVMDKRRPKLSRPKKWATDRLYKFLWEKMEPKYNIRTRVRSEKFIGDLSNVATIIQRRTKYENYKKELNTLLREMAHLGIIKTRNDFHLFCQDFLPYEFRIKVIPMLLPGNVRNIPFYPEKLHTPILDSLD